MSLEAIMQAMQNNDRAERPRASAAESLNILRGHITALNRENTFAEGQHLRIKPDLRTGIFSRANPVYVFLRYLENPIDYTETIRDNPEALRGATLSIHDCVVLGLDQDNEVVQVLASSSWFEEAV